ncbi:MAG: phosphoribosylglycinamide formyltransferase [Planctomycetota bacterium]|nr:MAG: phosphoribosylglycinamide formyltransferase [Planctomycetota bacterium]
MREPLRLAVLLSGAGRTLQNLVDRIAAGALPASVAVALSSKRGAAGRDVALRNGLPLAEVFRAGFPDEASFGEAVHAAVQPFRPDLVVLAGFLHFLPIPASWRGRVVNIHPALLPKFGGKGMYGDRVHEAVLASGDKESGCTVHWVDDVYDHGELILQKRVPVLAGDTTDTLSRRVFQAECEAYPEALAMLAQAVRR